VSKNVYQALHLFTQAVKVFAKFVKALVQHVPMVYQQNVCPALMELCSSYLAASAWQNVQWGPQLI